MPGVGAHGASPNTGKDPVYMGSQIVIALQGLVSRERAPLLLRADLLLDGKSLTYGNLQRQNRKKKSTESKNLEI